MAEFLPRHAPLNEQRLAQGAHKDAALAVLATASRFIFRGSTQASAVAGEALGCELPVNACRASQHADRAALWLGPSEWLLLAPEVQENVVELAISQALRTEPHALVNISHRNVGLEIVGPQAATLLAAGCPIDLHYAAFPTGMCTRTILAKAEIVLWRTAAERFHLDVWRSFVPYVWDFLIEARARL
jgi:sarcosine oxidase subunit gamma